MPSSGPAGGRRSRQEAGRRPVNHPPGSSLPFSLHPLTVSSWPCCRRGPGSLHPPRMPQSDTGRTGTPAVAPQSMRRGAGRLGTVLDQASSEPPTHLGLQTVHDVCEPVGALLLGSCVKKGGQGGGHLRPGPGLLHQALPSLAGTSHTPQATLQSPAAGSRASRPSPMWALPLTSFSTTRKRSCK